MNPHPSALLRLTRSTAVLVAFSYTAALATAQGPRGLPSVLENPQVKAAVDREVARDQARKLYERRDYTQAAPALRALAVRAKTDGRLWHQLGICLIRSGKPEAAAEAFQSQFDQGFARDNAQFNLACSAAQNEQLDRAFRHLDQAIAIGYLSKGCIEGNKRLEPIRKDPRYKKIVERTAGLRKDLKLANQAWDRDRYAEAVERYNGLLAAGFRSGCLLHQLGVSQIRAGQQAAAERSFLAQIEMGYDVGTACYNIACTYALRQNTEQALRWLEKGFAKGFHPPHLMRTDEDLASIRSTRSFEKLRHLALRKTMLPKLSKMAMDLADWEGAAAAANERLSHSATNGAAIEALADAQTELGQSAQALESTRKQIVADHEVRGGLLRLAKIHQQAGQHQDAADCIERAIEAGCRDCCDVKNMLTVASGQSEYTAARTRLADAKVLDAFDAIHWSDLERTARKKLKKRPENGPALHMLASALLRLDRQAEARAALQQQITSGHWADLAKLNMARSFEIAGQRDQAMKWLTDAVASGLRNADYITRAPRLDSLRQDPRYAKLAARMREAAARSKKRR